ncbi:MAG: methyltransferase domain-containing protein [bacterium]|nr:methyltransferase domain-containing protein [bacterium]
MTEIAAMDRVKIPILSAISGALSGKTIGRVYFNEAVRGVVPGLSGRVLDLAGGKSPSYLPLLPNSIELVRTDITASPGVTKVDINEPLPFPDKSFDAVFLFNALYATEDPSRLAGEIHRVLKPGGSWYLASPFVANEMPEPHDYLRFTAEGLERLCHSAGFSSVEIVRLGERATAATQLLHPFFLFNVIRALVYSLALLFDMLIPSSVKTTHPSPIGYFVRATK